VARRGRILAAGGGALLVVISSAWWGPQLLVPRLISEIEARASAQLRGELSLGVVSLSALKGFPQLTLTIDDVSLTGEGAFAGEELLAAGRLEATIELWPALRGTYIVDALSIHDGTAALQVAEDGSASWDLFVPTEEQPAAEASPPLQLSVNSLTLDRVTATYLDVPGKSSGLVGGLSGTGALTLDGDDLTLVLQAAAEQVTYIMDGVAYIEDGTLSADATLHSQLAESRYTFDDNRLVINALPLTMDGSVGLEEDGIDLDLRFTAADAGLKELLSAVPAIYAREYESIDAIGKISVDGSIIGRSTEALLPALSLDVTVADGRLRYPGLPGEVSDIVIDASLSSPAGPDLDKLAVDIRTLSGSLAGQSFDARLRVTDTQTDPFVDAALKMDLDLGRLGEFIPLGPDEAYSGRLRTDVRVSGRASAATEERYADFTATGPIAISGLRYDTPDFPHPIEIDQAAMSLTPAGLQIERLQARTGSSDALVTGQIDDLMGYVFEDADLQGSLSVTSTKIDMADFSVESEEAEAESAAGVVEVPAGYAMSVVLSAAELIYDDLRFEDVSGKIDIRDQRATLSKMALRGLGGRLSIDGSYTGRSGREPELDFMVGLLGLDIAQLAAQLDLATALAPIAAHAQGDMSAEVRLAGRLDQAMAMVLESLASSGQISSQQLTLTSVPALAALGEALGRSELADVAVRGLALKYELDQGRITLPPAALTLGQLPAVLSGTQGIDGSLDYTLAMDVPLREGGPIWDMVAGLVGEATMSQADTLLPETVTVAAALTGNVRSPKVALSLSQTRDQLLSGLRGAAEAALGAQIERVRDAVDAAISDAAQKVLDEAQTQADAILAAASTASDLLLDEADQQAKAMINATNNAVTRAVAEAAADKLKKEARKKSRQLLAKAESEAEALLSQAEAKAAKL
jgi:hypothetical protein